MYTIGRTFTFSPASLPDGYQKTGWISNTFAVEVILRSEQLEPPGLVADFTELAVLGGYLDAGLAQPSTALAEMSSTYEHLARHLFAWCVENLPLPLPELLTEVRVSGTPTAWASYHRPSS